VKRVFGLDTDQVGAAPHVVAVGAFDGVHLGHVHTLREVCQQARKRGVASAALTFDPSPRELDAGIRQPGQRLTPLHEQLHLLEHLGLDLALVLEFPGTVQQMPPETFAREVLVGALNAVCVCASETHRFGAGGRGDVRGLQRLARDLGFEVIVAEPFTVNARRVSSTWVRELLAQGQVHEAAALLGRPYAIFAEVVSGRGAGASLGFPTANLRIPPEKTIPRDGVYAGIAARVTADCEPLEEVRPAAINVGSAPTFGREDHLVEAHIVGQQDDLGGAHLKIELLRWLRRVQRFADEDALARQIAEDVNRSREAAQASESAAHGDAEA